MRGNQVVVALALAFCATTLNTLAKPGITLIGLVSKNQEIALADDSRILGTTTYAKRW